MVSNCEYFRTSAAKLKCITIILLLTSLALALAGVFMSKYTTDRESVRELIGNKSVNLWREIYLLCALAFCLCVSSNNLLAHLLSREIYWNRMTAIYDFVYHALSFLLLVTAGMLTIVSAVKIYEINCSSENGCQEFELKFAAGGLSMVTALVCGITAAVVLTNRKEVERDAYFAGIK